MESTVETDAGVGKIGSGWKPAVRIFGDGIKVSDKDGFRLTMRDPSSLVADTMLENLELTGRAGTRTISSNLTGEVLFDVSADFEIVARVSDLMPEPEADLEPEPAEVVVDETTIAAEVDDADDEGAGETAGPTDPTPMTAEDIAEQEAYYRRAEALRSAARVHQGRGAPSGIIVATAEDFERYLSGDADSEDLKFF